MRQLNTARDVVNALGGPDAVAKLTGARSTKNISHWVCRARTFPARYHYVMTTALQKKKADAPPWLWNQASSKRR